MTDELNGAMTRANQEGGEATRCIVARPPCVCGFWPSVAFVLLPVAFPTIQPAAHTSTIEAGILATLWLHY